ncbi:uncharacterized protein LOC122254084 [Penaeus japonicus]|uniref:uncharacterized protein LOC122254084 n=1 Tax=Penaeus japonicus TaxID=27405 RepID=UPI001C712A4E|nr:uncharacterized protein LOC122254084 [Penaeus japonicus]
MLMQTFHTTTDPITLYQPLPHPGDPTGGHTGEQGCHRVFWSNGTRHGNFDTSALTPSGRHCWLRFVGQQDEVIQVSLFKYKLGGRSCSSEVSIYDGIANGESDNLLRQVCGPVSREPRDSRGRFVQPEFLLSSANLLEIHLRLGMDTDVDKQFLVGAYQFHNSRLEGTKKPNSVCDVMFYGADSPTRGTVHNPPTTLLWNVEGSLTCSYLFVPTTNQSLSLVVSQGKV